VTVRTAILPVMDRIRTLLGVDGLDLRTTTVTQRIRSWSGGDYGPEVGLGTPTDTDLELEPRPRVKRLPNGDVEVGPITPYYTGTTTGGYTVAQLNPDISSEANAGKHVFWILDGPNGTHYYQLVAIDTTKNFRYMLRLTPTTDSGRRPPL